MIRGILFDLSGVFYIGQHVIPGAVEALNRIRASGIPYRFVTNVSRMPASRIISTLYSMGIEIDSEHLVTAPIAALAYINKHQLRPYILVHPELEYEFSGVNVSSPNAVLVGDAEDAFNYQRLNEAFRLLIDGAEFLALGDNRYFKDQSGLCLDIGPFIKALEFATDQKPTILGKPSADFFSAAVRSMDCTNNEVVMIGDDVDTDVNGALSAGLLAILVRTGKFRAGDEMRLPNSKAIIRNDVVEAVNWVLQNSG
ncbi:MAG: TIGR01458 family HAD-type hydrolase [Rhodothermales bacterium]|nr:TIGR01458 family HAD-type hydrolase [Rhodothermales bacterium]